MRTFLRKLFRGKVFFSCSYILALTGQQKPPDSFGEEQHSKAPVPSEIAQNLKVADENTSFQYDQPVFFYGGVPERELPGGEEGL